MVKVREITLPAFLASALVNGDTSGLDDEGLACFARCIEIAAPWEIVDVARDSEGNAEEPRFTWAFRLYGGDADGGDVLNYIAHEA